LNANGSFTYTPASGFTGTDSFTYVPHGTYVIGSSATVTITVASGVAEPPAPPPPSGSGDLSSGPPGLSPGGGGEAGIFYAAPPAMPASGGATTAVTAAMSQPVPAATPVAPPPVIVAPSAASTPAVVPFNDAVPVTPLAITPPPFALAPPIVAAPPVIVAPSVQSPSATIAGAPPASRDPWFDTTRLMAAPEPIMLPGFTLPGDETSSLMMPVAPEISRLPEAFAAAAQRFTERPAAIVTFVDPLTGQADDDEASASGDPGWRLVDVWRDGPVTEGLNGGTGLGGGDAGVMTSVIPTGRILWDNHPP